MKTIAEVGVNPYANIPKDSFYQDITLLKSKIDRPLTRREFLQYFVPVNNKLRLCHTYVNSELWFDKSDFDKKEGTYFPVSVTIEKNRLFVDKDYSLLNLSKGDEIIALNNIKSEKIIDSLSKYPNRAAGQRAVVSVFARHLLNSP